MLKQGTKSAFLKNIQLKHGGLFLFLNGVMGKNSIELCVVGVGWSELAKYFYKPAIENVVLLEEY